MIEILAQELYNGYGSCSEGTGNGSSSNKNNSNNSFSWSELGEKASKIVSGSAGIGSGLGGDIKAGPVSVSAGAFNIDEVSLEDGKFGAYRNNSAEIGVGLTKNIGLGAEIDRKTNIVDYYTLKNPKSEDSWSAGLTVGENTTLAIASPGRNNDIVLQFGGKAGLFLALEIEVDINISQAIRTVGYAITGKK